MSFLDQISGLLRFYKAGLTLGWKLYVRLLGYRAATDMEIRDLAFALYGDDTTQDDVDEMIEWWRTKIEK
ncbi:MAG: hypothetical protein OXF23_00420 [Candidatus Dadabacteria bacterium]|nr:hypothetical protein [Candidatus Dadabacteria bacterium]